jgi:hypothetical protein
MSSFAHECYGRACGRVGYVKVIFVSCTVMSVISSGGTIALAPRHPSKLVNGQREGHDPLVDASAGPVD